MAYPRPEPHAQLARAPPRPFDAQKMAERPRPGEKGRRIGAFAQVAALARVEMALRGAIDAERLFKPAAKHRKLTLVLSRQRLRGRTIRVLLMLPTHCRKELGGGRHQIDAILSPVRSADNSSEKDLTDSRKGAILVS